VSCYGMSVFVVVSESDIFVVGGCGNGGSVVFEFFNLLVDHGWVVTILLGYVFYCVKLFIIIIRGHRDCEESVDHRIVSGMFVLCGVIRSVVNSGIRGGGFAINFEIMFIVKFLDG